MSDSSEPQNNFSFDSLKSSSCDDKQRAETCFHHFCHSSDGLNYESFAELLERLFVDSEGTPYHIPLKWKRDWFALFDINHNEIIEWKEFEIMWNQWIKTILEPKSALIIVDVQNDFISGSLAINQCPAQHNGEDVIPVINKLIESVPFDKVIYTQDWHPEDHISFFNNKNRRKFKSIDMESETRVENETKLYDTVIFEGPPQMKQKLWPTHCVQQSWGSEIHCDLKIKDNSIRILKGTQSHIDSYSAFWDNQRLSQTDLNQQLTALAITDVYFCGIATDVCVGYSAIDAIECGYRTVVVENASRGLSLEDIDRIKQILIESKAVFIDSSQVLDMVTGADRRPELAFSQTLKELN